MCKDGGQALHRQCCRANIPQELPRMKMGLGLPRLRSKARPKFWARRCARSRRHTYAQIPAKRLFDCVGSHLVGVATSPEVHMLRSKYKEALSIGQEAVQVFVKTGHKRNQAGRCVQK